VKLCKGGREHGRRCSGVDGITEVVELFKGNIPLAGEDIRSEFTPVSRNIEIGVGG
jgi:hypothetical protein